MKSIDLYSPTDQHQLTESCLGLELNSALLSSWESLCAMIIKDLFMGSCISNSTMGLHNPSLPQTKHVCICATAIVSTYLHPQWQLWIKIKWHSIRLSSLHSGIYEELCWTIYSSLLSYLGWGGLWYVPLSVDKCACWSRPATCYQLAGHECAVHLWVFSNICMVKTICLVTFTRKSKVYLV